MTTRKAPGAWGRGRSIVLTSAFVLMLMSTLVMAPAAFAVPKAGASDAPGRSGAAPGHAPDRTEGPAATDAKPKTPGPKGVARPTVSAEHRADPPRKKSGASTRVRTRAKVRRAKVAARSVTATGSKQDWGPNQPVSDKYDGPCTRHDDTYRKGPGHDWHRGKGLGHIGVRPSAPATSAPSRPPTGTPGGGPTPAGRVRVPLTEEPLLPFTETVTAEPFLPFTGSDPGVLLLIATGCALTGTGLRLQARRLHSHRRI